MGVEAMPKPKRAKKSPDRITIEDVLGPKAHELDQDTLGHTAAVTIATHCAGTSPNGLGKTLLSLGVNGTSFQMCVYGSVKFQGYAIEVQEIPDGPNDLLISVVTAIENSPRKG
jgi:hypothetical protein